MSALRASGRGRKKVSIGFLYTSVLQDDSVKGVHVSLLVYGYGDLLMVLLPTDRLSLLRISRNTCRRQCTISGRMEKKRITLHIIFCDPCQRRLLTALYRPYYKSTLFPVANP